MHLLGRPGGEPGEVFAFFEEKQEKRLHKVRHGMEQSEVDGLLILSRPNVRYLSGFTGTSGFLLVTRGSAFLFADFRYRQQAREETPGFEVVDIKSPGSFQEAAEVVLDHGLGSLGVEEAHISLREYSQLKKALGEEIVPVPLSGTVEAVRAVKDRDEVEQIFAAAEIADGALREVLPLVKPGVSEHEVACELEYRMRRGGSERAPFDVIVASGARSALPHGVAGGKIIGEGEPVIIDLGATRGGYCSDMTRTFFVGTPDREQEEVYTRVLHAQEAALEHLRAGLSGAEADRLARGYLEDCGLGKYFGHGLGHGVGLEVHELPTLSPRGKDLLQEGMVFTVEPGVYIEGWGGVRIEDLVVLEAGGPRVLSRKEKSLESSILSRGVM